MRRILAMLVAVFFLTSLGGGPAIAGQKILKMSTTTSTEASGLLDVLLPALEKDTGIKVKVVAKGTGAAIRDGMDGNVDVILVHAKSREMKFVKDGWGTQRYPVMHNDFVILGPPSDPAGVKGSKDSIEALKRIAAAHAMFISRGDDSGTHTKEQFLWTKTGLPLAEHVQALIKKGKEVKVRSKRPADSDKWYLSIGQGMGKTLTYADEKQAYTLSDRGTYIKYKYGKTTPIDLVILFEGDKLLANPYGVIPISPKKYPDTQYDLAMKFVKWLTSARGQKVIEDYRLIGKQLFYPDAIK